MHDDGTAGGPMRQVKVDNWGIFFLQRLQQFFNRSDHCDLTLQFAGNVKIKVHRLVLNACTEYFQALEKKHGKNKDNVLTMPSDLSPDVVLPIINFMYTGRLEFRDSLTKKLYYTAGRLNMPVLTKLLDAQGASEVASEPSTPAHKSATPTILSKSPGNSYAKKSVSKELPETLPGRKLPIWKKRRTPFLMSSFDDPGPAESAALAPDHVSSIKEEPARPTRFEWPEDEEALKSYVPPFDSITYESAPLQMHSQQPAKPPVEEKKTTFEELQSRYQPVKRIATPLSDSETSPKKSKMDIQSVKEYLQEQEVRKQIVSNEEDSEECMEEGGMALGDVVEDDDDDDDERDAESILPDHDDCGVSQSTSEQDNMHQSTTQTKSILKQRFTDEGTPGSKKVRFSLGNQQQEFTNIEEYTTDDIGEGSSDMQASPANHAKIISEVLKKYPHLVRDNKNIRLRIMKQGSCTATENEAKNKKVSYVVLKAGDTGGKNRSPAKVIVKTGGRVEHISGLMATSSVTKPVSGAENTTGPWLCFSCGSNEDPIHFETYYLYRRHLQDVHMEKIDARICEHCGHRASKRNLLLYHLYTKHNIVPPRNCQFPKCDQCEYVALSESLLIKHRNNHSNAKDFVCKVCNASFKSNGALQGHMQTNLHSDPDKKKYECPYCRKPFVRNINLKAHVRTAHKDIDRKFEEEEQQEIITQEIEMADPKKKKRREILLLRGKESNNTEQDVSASTAAHSLEPSSEAEALSNVASGIAASLGLADQLAEVSEHQTVVQTMPAADGTVQTFIISAVPGQEYIVPEMLGGGNPGDQYQIATTSTLADLVQYDGNLVSSLGGAPGSQTIVITSAPSGGQEHLKLISADGSPLDQVILGQNIIVTNPDGTTSTASAADGYQAILQNGVLHLQQVGTHVIQGDGETVGEETLQYHVAHPGTVILSQDEVHKQVEQSMALMTGEDVDSKPYTLVTSNEPQMEETHHLESQDIEEQEHHKEQEEHHHHQEHDDLSTEKPLKSRIIGTSIPIHHEENKAQLVSASVQAQMVEIHQEHLESESTNLSVENQAEEIGTISHENEELDQQVMTQEMSQMPIESSDGQVLQIAEEVNDNAVIEEDNELHELHQNQQEKHDATEESCEVELEQEQVETEQMQLEMEDPENHQQQIEGELVESNNEEISQEMAQQEVYADSEVLKGGEREILQEEVLVEDSQYQQVEMVEKDEGLETMPLQVVEEVEQVEEIENQDEEEETMIIEEQGALMIEAEETTHQAEEETEQEVVLMNDEQVTQDVVTDEEQGNLMIEAEPQSEQSEENSQQETSETV